MKILVLGSNSFISKEIKDYFSNKEFVFLNRNILNLENTKEVNEYFDKNYYDFVINTCALGSSNNSIKNFNILNSNLLMFNNLLNNINKFGNLFTFCSGAAFDRRRELYKVHENEIFCSNPIDYYGLSKNIIARESLKHKNIYNFRIFGCFGKHEIDSRLIKNSLNRLNNGKNICIKKDKYMDYISAYDVCKILEYYINNIDFVNERDINLVYDEKIKLSELASKLLKFKNSNNSVIIEEEGLDKTYTGSSDKLSSMKIDLLGLEDSIKRIIDV